MVTGLIKCYDYINCKIIFQSSLQGTSCYYNTLSSYNNGSYLCQGNNPNGSTYMPIVIDGQSAADAEKEARRAILMVILISLFVIIVVLCICGGGTAYYLQKKKEKKM